ncbi:Arc family DNA-binding protein [Citrobacter koseri]|nr:Arc family DNA-binding protein [Citrobacter koseri]MBL4565072.1 Arc family DNA-binding protein [Citrobacter koseri]
MAERKYKHPQVNLRLPEELKEKIASLAEKNKRSANAEMVAAIEYWVAHSALDESIHSEDNESGKDQPESFSVTLTEQQLAKIADLLELKITKKVVEQLDIKKINSLKTNSSDD